MSLPIRTKTQPLAQPTGNAPKNDLARSTVDQGTPEARLLASPLAVPDLDEATLNRDPFFGWTDFPNLARFLIMCIKDILGVRELGLEDAHGVQQIFEAIVNAAIATFNDLKTVELNDTWLRGVATSQPDRLLEGIDRRIFGAILKTLMESRHQLRLKKGLHVKPITPLGKAVEHFRNKMECKALKAAKRAAAEVLEQHGAGEEEQCINLRPISDSDVEILKNFLLIPEDSISRSHIFALPPHTKQYLRHTCQADKIAADNQQGVDAAISAEKFLRGEVAADVPEGWPVVAWQMWVRCQVALSTGDNDLMALALEHDFEEENLDLLDSSEDEDEDEDLDDVASTIFGPFEDEDEDMELDATEDGNENDDLDDNASIIFDPFEDEDEEMDPLDTTEDGDEVEDVLGDMDLADSTEI